MELLVLIVVILLILLSTAGGIVLILKSRFVNVGRVLVALPALAIISVVTLYASVLAVFAGVHGEFYSLMAALTGVAVAAVFVCLLWRMKKRVIIVASSLLSACILTTVGFFSYQMYVEHAMTLRDDYDLLSAYAPYATGTKVASLDEKSTLTFESEFPKMDGATALYPIYSAFAKATYPEEILSGNYRSNDYLACSTTANAYENIIKGEADIIFAAAPSFAQEQLAINNGVELVYTPIGKEAFVFFVNSRNPVDGLTVEQLQGIYSGAITDWGELGAKRLGDIRAFQREAGSGSQTMLVRFMDGKELMTPPTEDVVAVMGGIISRAADYKNYKNSIGYSFRFYSTEMVKNKKIKLLSVNGVEPTVENIENGTYPIADNFYAVTRSDASENTKKLLEWLVGEQGQELVEKTGYTPLNK